MEPTIYPDIMYIGYRLLRICICCILMKECFVLLTFSWFKLLRRVRRHLPEVCPECPKCNLRLSTYVFPGDGYARVLGLTCLKCSREWLLPRFIFTDEHLRDRLVTIDYDGSQFFDTLPTGPSAVPDLTQVQQISDLKPGYHICWPGHITTHHAIVVAIGSDYYTVIHFTRSDNNEEGMTHQVNGKCVIKKESIVFSNDDNQGRLCRVDYNEDIVYDTRVIIARAYFMYENRELMSYSLLRYNCESLATFCTTGVARTFQGERVTWFIDRIPGGNTVESSLNSLS